MGTSLCKQRRSGRPPAQRRRLAFEQLELRALLSAQPYAGLADPPSGASLAAIAEAWPGSTDGTANASASSAQSSAAVARAGASSASLAPPAAIDPVKTAAYIAAFDPAHYLQQGADFTNPDYTPEGAVRRVGKPLDQIDIRRDYDVAKLSATEARLAGVDRHAALAAIFQKLTAGLSTNRDKHLAVLRFLQQSVIHNSIIQPTYTDGTPAFDPLVLLELGEMQCGFVARLAVDLFAAAGYQGRVVQLTAHQIAEIYYDNSWHYFDADLFGNGASVFNPDGSVPSVEQLSQDPFLIDSLPSYWEPDPYNQVAANSCSQPSYYYFSRAAWDAQYPAGRTPYVIYKTASTAQENSSRLYGWEYRRGVDTPERRLHDMPRHYAPAAPTISAVQIQRLSGTAFTATISWDAPLDGNDDLVGYKVLVSRQARGWNYDGQSLPAGIMSLKSSNTPWNFRMYAARFTLPRSEVLLDQTTATFDTLTLPGPGDYYVTVMAVDAHGQAVGRTLYPMSEEIRLRGPQPPSVVINRAAGQADRTNQPAISFTVKFSEPVTGFSAADVTLSGTARPTRAVVSPARNGDGSTYTVTVSGMTRSGTVVAAVGGGLAWNAIRIANLASTSTDNSVLYTLPATQTSIASSSSSVVAGQPLTFTAKVMALDTSFGHPTGSVVFKDGATVLGTAQLDATGKATFRAAAGLDVGLRTITATYSPRFGFLASSASLAEKVDPTYTTTQLTAAPALTVFGQPVTFAAVVKSGAPSVGIPTGTVVFRDGMTILGTVSLDAGGKAMLRVAGSTLKAGSHLITATYSGSAGYTTSSYYLHSVKPAPTVSPFDKKVRVSGPLLYPLVRDPG